MSRDIASNFTVAGERTVAATIAREGLILVWVIISRDLSGVKENFPHSETFKIHRGISLEISLGYPYDWTFQLCGLLHTLADIIGVNSDKNGTRERQRLIDISW